MYVKWVEGPMKTRQGDWTARCLRNFLQQRMSYVYALSEFRLLHTGRLQGGFLNLGSIIKVA